MTIDLQCEDFAGELLAIPPQSVATITVTAENRVWVSITSDLWHRQIEAKNTQAVTLWGHENKKLIEE